MNRGESPQQIEFPTARCRSQSMHRQHSPREIVVDLVQGGHRGGFGDRRQIRVRAVHDETGQRHPLSGESVHEESCLAQRIGFGRGHHGELGARLIE